MSQDTLGLENEGRFEVYGQREEDGSIREVTYDRVTGSFTSRQVSPPPEAQQEGGPVSSGRGPGMANPLMGGPDPQGTPTPEPGWYPGAPTGNWSPTNRPTSRPTATPTATSTATPTQEPQSESDGEPGRRGVSLTVSRNPAPGTRAYDFGYDVWMTFDGNKWVKDSDQPVDQSTTWDMGTPGQGSLYSWNPYANQSEAKYWARQADKLPKANRSTDFVSDYERRMHPNNPQSLSSINDYGRRPDPPDQAPENSGYQPQVWIPEDQVRGAGAPPPMLPPGDDGNYGGDYRQGQRPVVAQPPQTPLGPNYEPAGAWSEVPIIQHYTEKRADGKIYDVYYNTATGQYRSELNGQPAPNLGEQPKGGGGAVQNPAGDKDAVLNNFVKSTPWAAQWIRDFMMQHYDGRFGTGGPDPVEFFMQPNNWRGRMDHQPTPEEALQLALQDKAWGDNLFQKRGFGPTESDWVNRYYAGSPANYTPPTYVTGPAGGGGGNPGSSSSSTPWWIQQLRDAGK